MSSQILTIVVDYWRTHFSAWTLGLKKIDFSPENLYGHGSADLKSQFPHLHIRVKSVNNGFMAKREEV